MDADHNAAAREIAHRCIAGVPFRTQEALHSVVAAISGALVSARQEGRREGLEEAVKVAEPWTRAGDLLLRAGEMTAQEKRTALAVTRSILEGIRAIATGKG